MNNRVNAVQQRVLVMTKNSHLLSCVCKAKARMLRKVIMLLCLIFVRLHPECCVQFWGLQKKQTNKKKKTEQTRINVERWQSNHGLEQVT